MKRIKINIAVIAMILGVTSAFAFKAPVKKHFAKQIYGRDANGNWSLVGSKTEGTGSGQFTCESSDLPCRALFNSQPVQNAMPASGDVIEDNGDYTVH